MNSNLLFSGIEKLYGPQLLNRLQGSHLFIVGLGGVGSWAAEALVRSGVGEITLVDYDEICIGNSNRQLHTTTETIGQPKVQVLAKRFIEINPNLKINSVFERFDETTSAKLLKNRPDIVVDCTDRLKNKIHLINECMERKIPVVTVGSSGNRVDPTQIRIADLNETTNDRLLFYVRKRLRERHGFPTREISSQIRCIYSLEQVPKPTRPKSMAKALDCSGGLGSVTYITGTFGFFAASEAVRILNQ